MRKEKPITIVADGRDKGKVFMLREMPASQAEAWAIRAFLAMAKSGAEVPDDVRDMGILGLARLGIIAMSKMSYADAAPLLEEMFQCVSILPDPTRASSERRLVEEDIEEVATRLKLRVDLWELHTGFPVAAAPSTQSPAAATGEST